MWFSLFTHFTFDTTKTNKLDDYRDARKAFVKI